MSSDRVVAHLEELAVLAHRCADELAPTIDEFAEKVRKVLRGGGKLMFCGNGGSAADAQHLAAEYVVRFSRDRAPLAAIALTTDSSVLTAAGNDLGFEKIFARQVGALGRKGDLLILHSTSGESENLVRAAETAAELGIETVALVARGGGRLGEMADLRIVIPTDGTARAQELHLAIGHIVCEMIDGEPGEVCE